MYALYAFVVGAQCTPRLGAGFPPARPGRALCTAAAAQPWLLMPSCLTRPASRARAGLLFSLVYCILYCSCGMSVCVLR
jgi:hypothetical protein